MTSSSLLLTLEHARSLKQIVTSDDFPAVEKEGDQAICVKIDVCAEAYLAFRLVGRLALRTPVLPRTRVVRINGRGPRRVRPGRVRRHRRTTAHPVRHGGDDGRLDPRPRAGPAGWPRPRPGHARPGRRHRATHHSPPGSSPSATSCTPSTPRTARRSTDAMSRPAYVAHLEGRSSPAGRVLAHSGRAVPLGDAPTRRRRRDPTPGRAAPLVRPLPAVPRRPGGPGRPGPRPETGPVAGRSGPGLPGARRPGGLGRRGRGPVVLELGSA